MSPPSEGVLDVDGLNLKELEVKNSTENKAQNLELAQSIVVPSGNVVAGELDARSRRQQVEAVIDEEPGTEVVEEESTRRVVSEETMDSSAGSEEQLFEKEQQNKPEEAIFEASSKDEFELPTEPRVSTNRPSASEGVSVNVQSPLANPGGEATSTMEAVVESAEIQEYPTATEQVTETFTENFEQHLDVGERREIRLKLHPENLGELEVQVESMEDFVRAKIVASELATTEILMRDKDILNSALQDLGIAIEDVEIQHRDSSEADNAGQDAKEESDSGHSDRERSASESETQNERNSNSNSSVEDGINLIV